MSLRNAFLASSQSTGVRSKGNIHTKIYNNVILHENHIFDEGDAIEAK
jgi:hypothetical protein